MKIILGSSSKLRQQVMREMGIDFEIMSPDINEQEIRMADPRKLVLALAQAKARAIVNLINEPAIIITADQVISFKGQIREKPRTAEEAKGFLQSYGAEPSETINGIVVTNSLTKKQEVAIDIVKVFLKPIPTAVIEQLIKESVIFHCAGALRLEDPLMLPFIERVEGTADSLMGLPKSLTLSLIKSVTKSIY